MNLSILFIEQSDNWADFQKSIPGRGQSWDLEFANSTGDRDRALIIKQQLPMGKCWLWCPRGPQMSNYQDQTAWHNFIKEAKIVALNNQAIFLRVEPPVLDNQDIFWPKGFKHAHDHYLPEHTIIIDLSSIEQEILAQMKPKGRYNIKLAEKKGVKIYQSTNLTKDIKSFYQILTETTNRDGFTPHKEEYYQKMLAILQPQGLAELFLAEFEGKIIGGIIATFYKEMGTYYFGASSNEYRNVMAPYLLQWHAILEAKKRGCLYYDLLGVAPNSNDKKHPWAGITEFKTKFGGQMIHFQHAKEYVYNPLLYTGMKLYKKFR